MEQLQISQLSNTFALPENTAERPATNRQSDYTHYLAEQDLYYSSVFPYLIAGTPRENNTWQIHITIVRQQFYQLIRPLIRLLKTLDLPFAIPLNANQHSNLLDGRNGPALTGKVVTISVANCEEATSVARQLRHLTKGIIGPRIPCAYHLTTVIAVSFGTLFTQNDCTAATASIIYGSATAQDLQQVIKSKKLKWPFQDIKPLASFKQPRLLNRQYIPIENFKKDPKGHVFKALKINRIFDMQYCVIKQGRQYQSFDDSGRDAKDRLAWQYQIHKRFETKGVLPTALAYFELNGDAFFSMEYKESVSLTEQAVQLSEGHTWRSMPAKRKREMLSYLSQVADILHQFHEEGFVHRDVTPANFIITEQGRVFAIDIELCYHIRTRTPNPPFTLGTQGYMSPAQENGLPPSFKDDIYSFGALLVSVFTGILPNKLNTKSPKQLESNLSYFIDSPSLVTTIIACLNTDADLRPSLIEIKAVLELGDAVLLTTAAPLPFPAQGSPTKNSATVLEQGIKTLADLLSGLVPGEASTITGHPPPGTALSAELPVLALYAQFNPSNLGPAIIAHIDRWLAETTVPEHPALDLRISAAALSQIKPDAELLSKFLSKQPPIQDDIEATIPPGISGGLAGRGLKLLYLGDQQSPGQHFKQLDEIVTRIIALQQKDGSWTRAPETNGKAIKVTGFSHGVAGITYFLLSYYARNKTENLRIRIDAALNWLLKSRRSELGKQIWTVSAEDNLVDPWLEHGFSGVALTFIKAYEVLGDPHHQQIATEVLRYHPINITSNYYAFGNGMSGLGEIYLEASRVFDDEAWLLRATAIRDALLNSCYRDEHFCYWLDGTQLNPTPYFQTGNSGILHFLSRFEHPNEIPFPSYLIP